MRLSECNLIMKKSISSQSLTDLEMSDINNINTNQKSIIENESVNRNNYVKAVAHFYQVFVHVFIFSVFESLFFWLYIAKEEDQAILDQIEDVILLGDMFCTNTNDDIDFSSLYDYQNEKRENYNEKLPLNNTIMLNTYLFCTIILFNVSLKLSRVNIINLNCEILKHQSMTFILLFIYEYVFFKNIISNYVPNSSNKIIKKIFEKCI